MTRFQLIVYLCALVAMFLLYGRRRGLRRKLVADGRLPDRLAGPGASGWGPTFVVVALAFAFLWASDTYIAPAAGRVWANVSFGVAVFVVAFLVIFLRNRGKGDSVVSDALRLAKGGKTDEAVNVLRAAVAASPTPDRAGALGLVFAGANRWQEAAEAYRDARRIDPGQPIFAINLALALSKSGRGTDALPIIEEARRAAPQEAGLAAAECMTLATLGRAHEAAEQLRQAKELVEAAAGEQRLDMWTLGRLLLECASTVDATSTRGFPVVAAAAMQPGSEGGSGVSPLGVANDPEQAPHPRRQA